VRAWPWGGVAAVVAWSLWELRATVAPVAFLNDSAVHEQMVRFATARLRAGHDPLTSWFPYLGLGSPQFLHYQSLPAVLTGLAGLAVGPDAAFRWSLYLLWCLWPVAVYGSARLFGLAEPAAVCAAVVAPLLHSVHGVGYEQYAYVWSGFGVWTQLWGSWALPFAWALTWRAVADRRFIAPAAGLVALTAAFHFETGYLAFAAVLVMPFLAWRGLWWRLGRAAVLLAAALAASAWVVVPLLIYARWAAVNQALAQTPLVNGYGARQTLGWLVTGRLLDDGRLPVISLLAAAGLVAAVAGWRRPGPGRALVALLCGCLVLSFGRATFGGLIAVIPGHADLFFRRFAMGAQLASVYLAGLGAAAVAGQAGRLGAACARFLATRRLDWLARVPAGVMAVAGVALLVPAWRSLDAYDAANARNIAVQQHAQASQAPALAAVAAVIRRHGGGRTWAGSSSYGGRYFRVGFVPWFAYLAALDIDEVGFTLRTASLMSQPEYWFDPANRGDYALFGIRYLVVPALKGTAPPVPRGTALILRDSRYWVYELPGSTFIRVADTVGSLTANRADLGTQTVPYLRSALPGQDRYLTVGYAGARPAAPTAPPDAPAAGPPGTVVAGHPDLAGGRASAVVRLRRRAVVVLAASYDPGWTAAVDGHPAPVQMVSPALVGVVVPPGTHHITFRYTGFGGYPPLFALAAAGLLAVAVTTCRRRPRAGHRGHRPVPRPRRRPPRQPRPPLAHRGSRQPPAGGVLSLITRRRTTAVACSASRAAWPPVMGGVGDHWKNPQPSKTTRSAITAPPGNRVSDSGDDHNETENPGGLRDGGCPGGGGLRRHRGICGGPGGTCLRHQANQSAG
jgi:Bacterial membrane protein YfhO